MKHFNEQHDAVLRTEDKVISKNPQEGKLATYKETVKEVYFFHPIIDSRGNIKSYYKISVNKEMILDLSKQINEIEESEFQQKYIPELPF